MTEDKARKRTVRRRMAKTGERYTAARLHVVKDQAEPAGPSRVADPGMSDEKIKQATGRDWDHWLRALDRWGAKSRSHTEIARYVNQDLGVSGWWAQTIAVGYERARGMRAKYQRPDGFSVSVTRTLPFDADRLFPAFAEASGRRRWLEPGTLRVRTTQPGKTARFDFLPDGSRVIVSLERKGPGKTTVYVACEKLADVELVEERRAFWKERLVRLAHTLS